MLVVMIRSDVHSVDGRPGENGGVGDTHQDSAVRDVAKLSMLEGVKRTDGAAVQAARVESVQDGLLSHLPFGPLLQESAARSLRVVCHTFLEECLIKIVSLRSVKSVHNLFFLSINYKNINYCSHLID